MPELLAAWADEADPTTVPVAGGYQLRRFRCPRGHHPRMTPLSYLRSGCPSCRGQKTLEERLASVEIDPSTHGMNPEIASQWHPTKNEKVRLTTVSPGSRRTFWWRDPVCGHEWQATPADRDKGQRLRCPVCRTIMDSLAYHYPKLAAEWSPENPVSAWQIRPTSQTASSRPGSARINPNTCGRRRWCHVRRDRDARNAVNTGSRGLSSCTTRLRCVPSVALRRGSPCATRISVAERCGWSTSRPCCLTADG